MINELKMKIFDEYNKQFENNKLSELFISKNKLYSNQVTDIVNEEMFAETEPQCGWLAFVNPNILENYAHKCYYWFFTEDGTIIKNNTGLWMPSDNIELEKIV